MQEDFFDALLHMGLTPVWMQFTEACGFEFQSGPVQAKGGAEPLGASGVAQSGKILVRERGSHVSDQPQESEFTSEGSVGRGVSAPCGYSWLCQSACLLRPLKQIA